MLVSPDGDPLLADFGVSRMLIASGTLDHTTNIRGTARWMAVELLLPTEEGDALALQTTRTDVWAFGMTIYVRCFAVSSSVGPILTFVRNC